MMRNYYFNDAFAVIAEPLAQTLDLTLVNASVLARQRARRVHARDDHLVVLVKRFEIVRDEAPEFFERSVESRKHVPERHVVVAGHDDLRMRQPVEEGA